VVIPSVISIQFVGTISDPTMDLDSPPTFAGDRMLMRRDFMRVEPAILHPEYRWGLIESLVAESIAGELKLDPKDHPVLVSEASVHDRETRVKMTELLFEKFQVPAMYVVKNAVLSS
jgi:hypothetical protein